MNTAKSYCVKCGFDYISYEDYNDGILYKCLNPQCDHEWWIPKE